MTVFASTAVPSGWWVLLVVGIFIVGCFGKVVHIAYLVQARLRKTITEQQTIIDDLKRELEEVKRKQ